MSFLIDLFSDLTGLSTEPKYHLWAQDVDKKITRIQGLLSSLMGKNDRVGQVQDLMKRVHQALSELNPELGIEEFVGDTRSCQLMQQIRVSLLNMWSRLLLLLDKIDDTRTVVLFLETIHKIMVRSEFDSAHLSIDDAGRSYCIPEYIQAFKRYRQLLVNTHAHITLKLAESKPLSFTSSVLFGLELPMAYSKILAVNFFRLPDVGYTIIENITLDRSISYRLSDYEEKHDEEYYENKRKKKEEKRFRLKQTSSSTKLFHQLGAALSDEPDLPLSRLPVLDGLPIPDVPSLPDSISDVFPITDTLPIPDTFPISGDTFPDLSNSELKEVGNGNVDENLQYENGSTNETIDESGSGIGTKSESSGDTIIESTTNKIILESVCDDEILITQISDNEKQIPTENQHMDKSNDENKTDFPLEIEKTENTHSQITTEEVGGPSLSDVHLASQSEIFNDTTNIPPVEVEPMKHPKVEIVVTPVTEQLGTEESKSVTDAVDKKLQEKVESTNKSGSTKSKQITPSDSPTKRKKYRKKDGHKTKNRKHDHHHRNSTNTELSKLEVKDEVLDGSAAVAVVESQPRLFSWAQFHSALLLTTTNNSASVPGLHSSNTGLALSREAFLGVSGENKAWTNWFSSRSVLFLFMVKDWVDHVERMFSNPLLIVQPGRPTVRVQHKKNHVNWRAIVGYPQILDAFLYTLQHCPRITHPLQTASQAMLHCEPSLVNYFNRVVLSRTQLYSLPQVVAALLKLQSWLHEFKEMNRPLPSNFDLSYLCTALDAILSTDHHQLLQRILQLLYEVSDVFTGDLRKNIISEFLLKKYFFRLFLHWDEITRNYFHQFLLWKAVRVKRSQLGSGLALDQLPFIGKDKYDNTYPYVDPEVELNNDLAMFGKIQCYIQVVQDQLRHPAGETYEKNLEIYAPRALSEYQFFLLKYSSWEPKDKDWRLLPLALLDAKRRANFSPSFKDV